MRLRETSYTFEGQIETDYIDDGKQSLRVLEVVLVFDEAIQVCLLLKG